MVTRAKGLVKKLATAGLLAGALFLPSATPKETKADIIKITNATNPNYPIASFAGLLDMSYSERDTSPGYDDGIDAKLDTFISPYEFNFVTFSTLSGHDVSVNKTPKPHIGDTYTFNLGFENDRATNIYNKENHVTLNDFKIENSNGVTDWEYQLNVSTDGTRRIYDYTTSGLVSEIWDSTDKKFGQWEQDIRQGSLWRDGNGRHYGQITFTAIGEPIVHPGDLTRNGYVDFEDLSVLLSNWNKDGTTPGNLVLPDETPINFDDLTVLLSDWTGPAPKGSPEAALSEPILVGNPAVPEPSGLALALIGFGAYALKRPKRNRK